MNARPKLLVVDDTPRNIKTLEALLVPRGYAVVAAGSGPEALDKAEAERPDLILLDVLMPGMNGYEVCRRLRAAPATAVLPVVMITAADDQERVATIEAGADDFIQKPFNQAELLARIRSLLRIKSYHDTIEAQAAELAEWTGRLEQRVQEQTAQIERLSRLRRFLPSRLAGLLVSADDEAILESHRRQIAVVCCKLSGFAELAETSAPEELMAVLREYYAAMDPVVSAADATVGPLTGDELMLFFNDPMPVEEPAAEAVRAALALRDRVEGRVTAWRRRGLELGFVAGIDLGYATLGTVGLEGRSEYGPIGPVVHAASRLRDAAGPGEILVSQRIQVPAESQAVFTARSDVPLAGPGHLTAVYAVEAVRDDPSLRPSAPQPGTPLTPREREVAALIARGYSNRRIAEALVIAEATALRHVANILSKLEMTSRAQVAVWAVGQGLAVTTERA